MMRAASPMADRRHRPLDASATDSSVGGSGGGGGEGASSSLLREQQAERDRLNMDNFNLKMRVNYLEERLLRYQNGLAVDHDDLENDLLEARLALSEREQQLRERSLSMERAAEAIESLKQQLQNALAELERARAQSNQLEEMEGIRQELMHTRGELERCGQRLQGAEQEVLQQQQEVVTWRGKYDEEKDSTRRLQQELDHQRNLVQQMEQQQEAAKTEMERMRSYGQQEEGEVAHLKDMMEQLALEKQTLEVTYQSRGKRMEEQMQALQKECEKYRTDHLGVAGERDKLHFERERLTREVESGNQERARYLAEWERMSKELERVSADAESLRLQNMKLSTTCEHQAQSLEAFKDEREKALDNMHKLEGDAREWRRISSEREMAMKAFEMRARNAEAEITRLQERLEAMATHSQQSANERLGALEQAKNAMEAQNYDLRKKLASLQHQLESFEAKCRSYEERVSEETDRANNLKERCLASEREVEQRAAHAEQLEHQLAQVTSSSMSESAQIQQFSDQISRLTADRRELNESLNSERARGVKLQKHIDELEAENAELAEYLNAVGRELREIIGYEFGASSTNRSGRQEYRNFDVLIRDAKTALQRQFKTEGDALLRRWQHDAERMKAMLDRQSAKLAAGQAALETAQRTSAHAKGDVRSLDHAWSKKYENLRKEAQAAHRSLEEALLREKRRCSQLEADLDQARRDHDNELDDGQSTIRSLERDNEDLKESNRLLLADIQERRRAAEHARKQHLRAVAENKDLLDAIDILKSGITDRDKQIEYYKASLMKWTQQLHRNGSMSDVKEKLMEQLEQTQYMVNETYKRWSHSDIGMGGSSLWLARHANGGASSEAMDWVVQLDEHVGRIEAVCDRWSDFLSQAKDLHRRHNEGRRATAVAFRNGKKERPSWVDEVERKSDRLFNETVRISDTMRDVVDDVVNALQQARVDRKRRSRIVIKPRPPLSPAHGEGLSMEHFTVDAGTFEPRKGVNGLKGKSINSENNQKHTDHDTPQSRRDRKRASLPRSGQNATSMVHVHSLASLGRIGEELQAIEKKIKTYPE